MISKGAADNYPYPFIAVFAVLAAGFVVFGPDILGTASPFTPIFQCRDFTDASATCMVTIHSNIDLASAVVYSRNVEPYGYQTFGMTYIFAKNKTTILDRYFAFDAAGLADFGVSDKACTVESEVPVNLLLNCSVYHARFDRDGKIQSWEK